MFSRRSSRASKTLCTEFLKRISNPKYKRFGAVIPEDVSDEESISDSDNDSAEASAPDTDSSDDESLLPAAIPKKAANTYKWRRKQHEFPPHPFLAEVGCISESFTPYQYFKYFLTDDIFAIIANETNKYSVQKKGKSINTTSMEIEQFFGMLIYMGIMRLPEYRLHWSKHFRTKSISEVLTVNRFDELRNNFHLADNNQVSVSSFLQARE